MRIHTSKCIIYDCLLLTAFCLLPTVLPAQQPQAQAGQAIFPVNAKYVQGFGPGYWPTAGSNLTLNLAQGTAVCSNVVRTYAGGTLTLAPSATNYVYLNTSNNCVPASNTTGFTSTTIPIATVVTTSTAISSITDVRTMFVSGVSGGSGSVTSVGMAGDGIIFSSTVSGSPVTSSGTLTPQLLNQTPNTVLAGPGSGLATTPTFRALLGSDLPTIAIAGGGTGQSTASAAFNALSPLTTEGDLHYYHSSSNTRLGVGSNGQCLTSNGTDPLWGSCGTGGGVSSLSGDGNLITNSSSTGAVTLTLGTFSPHYFWGNNTGSAATAAKSLIGTSDTSVNWYAAGGGTAQAQTVTLSPAATALTAGLTVRWKPTAANTGSGPTLAVNGLTATTITKCGATALGANDLTTANIATAVYDGTEFQLLNPMAAGCGGGGNVSNSGTPTQYQTPAWVSSTQLQGIGPGASGTCFMSNGSSSYPSFQSCPSGGSMTWPSTAGVAVYAGSNAWGTSLSSNTTVNGQTCTLGSSCNANSGAAQYSVAINNGAGAAIAGLANSGSISGGSLTLAPTYAATSAAPTVTTTGGGSTTYTYLQIPIFGNLLGVTSATAAVTNGPSTLNSTNYNTITTSAVTGSTGCYVVRLIGSGNPSSPGILNDGTGSYSPVTCGTALLDKGLAGDLWDYTIGTTGDFSNVMGITSGLRIGPLEPTVPYDQQELYYDSRGLNVFVGNSGHGGMAGNLYVADNTGAVGEEVFVDGLCSAAGCGEFDGILINIDADTGTSGSLATSYSNGVRLNINGGGTVSQVFQYDASTGTSPTYSGGANIGTLVSYAVQAEGGTWTATNEYGMQITDRTRGTHNWAIQTGKGLVEFGDTVKGDTVTVSALPAAASYSGAWHMVSDSTAISYLGQTCVGGGSVVAWALSNGSTWSCFGAMTGGSGTGTVTSSSLSQYQVAVATSSTNITGVSVGAGQILQGASSANPTGTATPTHGVQNTTQGTLTLAGSNASPGQVILNTSGSNAYGVILQNLGSTAAWNFNLPTGAGSANQPLLSQGGGSTSNTWAAISYPTSANSGGIPYFSSSTAMGTSTALTQYGVVVGGGAGAPPTSTAAGAANMPLVGAGSANPAFSTIGYPASCTAYGVVYASSATQLACTNLSDQNTFLKMSVAAGPQISSLTDNATNVTSSDSQGFYSAPSSVAGAFTMKQGTASSAYSLTNAVGFTAPTSVTSWLMTLPGTGPSVNNQTFSLAALSSSQSTVSLVPMVRKSQLSSAYTNSTATASTIWSFSVDASATYTVHCHGLYTAASGGAFVLTLTGPASPGTVTYDFQATTGLSSGAPTFYTVVGTGSSYPGAVGSPALTTATTDMPFDINVEFVNGTTAGTLAIQGRTISTDTLTLEIGDACTIQ